MPLIGRSFPVVNSGMPEVVRRLRQVWDTGEPWRGADLPVADRALDGGALEQAYFSFACCKVRRRTPPDALLGFVFETTEHVHDRARLDQALGAARQRAAELEAVIDTMVEGVIAYDQDRHIMLVNATARRLLERDRRNAGAARAAGRDDAQPAARARRRTSTLARRPSRGAGVRRCRARASRCASTIR